MAFLMLQLLQQDNAVVLVLWQTLAVADTVALGSGSKALKGIYDDER